MLLLRRAFSVVSLLLIATSIASATTTVPGSVPVWATGDDVPTLGRIGVFSAELCGIDERGRLLIATRLSDGSEELVRVDGHARTSLLRFGSTTDHPISLRLGGCAVSSNGNVVLSGQVGPWSSREFSVIRVTGTSVAEMIRTGNVTSEGFPVSDYGFSDRVIGDEGTIAVRVALVGTLGEYPSNIFGALVAVNDHGMRIVAGNTAEVPVERRFSQVSLLAVTESGAIMFSGSHWTDDPYPPEQTGVYLDDGTGVTPVFVAGAVVPAGVRIGGIFAATSAGAVLFSGEREVNGPDGPETVRDVYRFDQGTVSLVVAGDGRTPDGARFWVDSGSLNDRGDVLLDLGWLKDDDPDACGPESYGLVLYSDDAVPRIIARDVDGGQVNQRGDVAVTGITGRGYNFSRWRNGKLSEMLSPGDGSPSGLPIAEGGFGAYPSEGKCLADDGRVAAFTTFVESSPALLCADADGIHVVARDGDAALQGLDFWRDLQCRFAGDDEMLFATNGAVFRATGDRVELVLGNGVGTIDGQPIDRVGDYDFRKTFAVNRRGTIAASQYGFRLFRLPRGGPLESIELGLGDSGDSIWTVHEAEIAEDDSIIVSATLLSDGAGSRYPTFLRRFAIDAAHAAARVSSCALAAMIDRQPAKSR